MTGMIKPSEMAKSDVLIIGGGISGITTALELSQLGITAVLVEKEKKLGGLANSFCCKATDSCKKCFACVVDKKVRDIEKNSNISFFLKTELEDLGGSQGSYQVTLNRGGEVKRLATSAVVVAAGIEPYEARKRGEYGYTQFQNVLTARDLEIMLRNNGGVVRPSDNVIPEKIAFIQCVGSRDRSQGNVFCSQVCCAYALRMINLIHHKNPEIQFAFYYMDIQPAGVHFADFLQKCRENKNIRFIRSIPSNVHLVPKTESLIVKFADGENSEVKEEIFDMIVLSVGMALNEYTKSLAGRLNINLSNDGFLMNNESDKGVFITGACSGPKDIDRSITQAKSTAYQIHRYLQERL